MIYDAVDQTTTTTISTSAKRRSRDDSSPFISSGNFFKDGDRPMRLLLLENGAGSPEAAAAAEAVDKGLDLDLDLDLDPQFKVYPKYKRRRRKRRNRSDYVTVPLNETASAEEKREEEEEVKVRLRITTEDGTRSEEEEEEDITEELSEDPTEDSADDDSRRNRQGTESLCPHFSTGNEAAAMTSPRLTIATISGHVDLRDHPRRSPSRTDHHGHHHHHHHHHHRSTDCVDVSPSNGRLVTDKTARASSSAAGAAPSSSTAEEDVAGGRRRRCAHCCKAFVAFLCSTVGLSCLMVGYVILGGVIFQCLEAPNEKQMNGEMRETRQRHVQQLWQLTESMNVLHPVNWTQLAEEILQNYTTVVYTFAKKRGWDGKEDDEHQELQWSFAGALLYSITVVTTIGYGHIAPKTDWGRVVTMLYAIVGIPLTLLTITNLGGFMATAFRFLYRNICCGLCCLCCSSSSSSSKGRRGAPHGRRRAPHGRRSVAGAVGDAPLGERLRRALFSTEDIKTVTVPIYVSLLLITGYIAIGALLFTLWETEWNYLIGCYFCFITLSTIGFGDYVPGTSLGAWNSQEKLVLCALYLLFGLALIAMCFDLMQEQARNSFKKIGQKLGLIDRQS